jgi:DnaJ-class molecular chaperone
MIPLNGSHSKLNDFALITSTGEIISEKDKCGQCKGQKVVQDKKLLEVHVEKGMQHAQKITFPGEADEAVTHHFCPLS